MIFYTERFVPAKAAGCCRCFVILIRPKYKNDIGLLAHEKVHRHQWLRSLGLHSFLYLFSETYRFHSEVEAYKEQAKHYPDDRRPRFAQFIANNYGIRVTEKEALEELMK